MAEFGQVQEVTACIQSCGILVTDTVSFPESVKRKHMVAAGKWAIECLFPAISIQSDLVLSAVQDAFLCNDVII